MPRSLHILVFLLFLLQAGCGSPTPDVVVEPVQQVTREPHAMHPLVAKIANILQDGWNVTQNGNTILVTRREPVTLYNNIALPPPGGGLKHVIENGRRVQYEITIEIGELVSKANYRKMAAVNKDTDYYLRITRNGMSSFASKGEYRPKTDDDNERYKKYQQELQELPYNRLPDLYDAQNSYYITTPRSRRQSFSYPQEERECRAVLGNIYSFAETHEDFSNATEEDEFFLYPYDHKVDKAFISARDYDSYVSARNQDLPKSQ